MADERIAAQVLARTDGTIGEITRLMEQAAIQAIESGIERIGLDTISVANYRSPNEGRMGAEVGVMAGF